MAKNVDRGRDKENSKSKLKVDYVVNMEDKVKLSLLNMEKRLMDLEFTISSISSRIENMDLEGLESDKDRLEELENMILVEQAGILELKRILEGLDSKFTSAASAEDITIIKDRVQRIEKLARAAAQMVDISTEMPEEARIKINKLEDAIVELKAMPSPQSIDPFEIADIKRNINLLDSKLDNLKTSLNELDDGLKDRVQKAIRNLENDPELASVDFNFINAKLETIKTVIDMLANKRVETELKISELEQKLLNVQKRGEESVPSMLIDAAKESKRSTEMLKMRTDAIEKVVRELTKGMKAVELSAAKFEGFERLSALQEDVDKKLVQFRFMQEEIKKLSNRIELVYEDLNERLNSIKKVERRTHAINEELRDVRAEFEKIRFDIKKSNVLVSDVRLLKDNLEELNKTVNRVASISESKTKVTKVAAKDTQYVNKVEDRLGMLENHIKDIIYKMDLESGSGVAEYDTKLDEIVSKLVFLETRMTALESVFQTSSKTHAMVLE